MIADNLPVLIVLVPLFGALLAPFVGGGDRSWAVALAASWSVFAGTLVLLGRVLTEGTVSYSLGGWPAPLGITYRIDELNAYFLVIVSGIAAVVSVPGRLTSPAEVGRHRLGFFHSVYLLCLTGLLGIAITGDAFNLYVLLEVASLATYSLVAMGRDRRARLAGFRYLVLGSIGATFVLLGIGYLYALTGTLDMLDIHARLAVLPVGPGMAAAFAFLLVGIGLKCALFPLHSWLPAAYTQAPSAVAALLAGTATKVGLYVLIRFAYSVFGQQRFLFELGGRPILLSFGAAAILYGSFTAIRQRNAARLLAWSSVGQVGYIVLGIALANPTALTGALLHVLSHAVTKGGLFLALGAVRHQAGSLELSRLRGLGERMPLTSAAIAVGGAGLVGMPLTAGFVSKWFLVRGCLEAGLWPLSLVVVAGALLAAVYAWRLVSTLYLEQPQPGAPDREAPWLLVLPTWALVGTAIVLGVFAGGAVGLARLAAEALS